ncbi:MAG TPA: AAA family ATPase [Desulfomicrobiaceae bacterium]|nr:AAA family ATPase [Desulfomicrobiaceae bacterium]
MYLEYYNLTRDPFSVSPDPDFLFLSPSHKEAIGSLLFCIENRLGFAVLTGEVGTGKTTIIRYYLANCDRERILPVYIFNPDLTFNALLQTILSELGAAPTKDSDLYRTVQSALLTRAEAGQTVVLLIDEAQNIPLRTLEQLRMLSNFETSREKLLQVIFIGQPELDEILEKHSLRQLRQRIATRAVIRPLTADETLAYIEHRTHLAGGDAARIFSSAALREISHQAHGAPRTVNILCANALIACIGYGQKQVTRKIVREIVTDLSGRAEPVFSRFGFGLAAAAVILLGVASAYSIHSILPRPESGAPERGASAPAMHAPSAPSHLPSADTGRPASTHANAEKMGTAAADQKTPPGSPRNNPGQPEPLRGVTVRDNASRSLAEKTAVTDNRDQPSPASAPSSSKKVVTRKVRRGDYLTRMSLEVYGEATDRTLSRLQNANPQIKDPDLIYEGDVLRFPEHGQ